MAVSSTLTEEKWSLASSSHPGGSGVPDAARETEGEAGRHHGSPALGHGHGEAAQGGDTVEEAGGQAGGGAGGCRYMSWYRYNLVVMVQVYVLVMVQVHVVGMV